MWDPYAEFESTVLPNGLSVYAAHWKGRPWQAMGFLIHTGSEHDPEGLEGIAHFIEHVVSANVSTPQKDIEALFQDCGGEVSFGVTGSAYTRYTFFGSAKKQFLAKAFSIFGEMLLWGNLEKCIERERKVIIREFNERYPTKIAREIETRRRQAVYAGYWPERSMKSINAIKKITQANLQSHYDAHYTPANISIVGVGGMRLEQLAALLLESPFAANKKGTRTPLSTPVAHVDPLLKTRYVVKASKYITAATKIQAGSYRSTAKIPGTINPLVIRVMNWMCDEALTEEMREKRMWTYAIKSSRYSHRYFYEFEIECRVALHALDKIEEAVNHCIASLRDRKELFEQCKRRILADYAMTDRTGRGVCSSALSDLAEDQRIITLAECKANAEKVTMGDIQNALQWLRPEYRWTLLMRP